MNSELEIVFAEDPPIVVLGELEVTTLSREDWPRAARLLEEEHYLGDTRPVGRTLVQAVHHQGRWVALLIWGPAALKLADRDADIGWTDSQRAERIGLVVQNRRFLVLAETRMPNLASRALALAVNALPAAWEQTHGYRPLLAETFTDIEAFEGTCYKAAAWQPCGTLPRGLAIDGKYVRNLVLTLCLSEHESGAPAAIAIAAQAPVSEETKKEGELTCARRLYATTPLHGATVTGDALNCEPQSITLVVENGGDALFQLKANQPNALKHAIDVAATHPPLLPTNLTNSTTVARNGEFTKSMR